MTPLKRNSKQIEAFHDQARFKYILAGRRGGKTHLLSMAIVKDLHECPYMGEIFYIGPTNQQAKEIIWENILKRLDQQGWRYKANVSQQCVYLSRKRKFYVIGAEKIRRIRGHKVYSVYIDELGYFTTPIKEIWTAVRPALSDYKGKAWLATTPDAMGSDAHMFWEQAATNEDWATHTWFTIDNPWIDPLEIEQARKTMTDKAFRQEYEASWESFDGEIIYYAYKKEKQFVKTNYTINPKLPVFITFDFNIGEGKPMSALLSQYDGKLFHAFDEVVIDGMRTQDSMDEIAARGYLDLANDIVIFGDATGAARSTNSLHSNYEIIKNYLSNYQRKDGKNGRFEMRVPKANPPIRQRHNAVNAACENAKGETSLILYAKCKTLDEGLRLTRLKKGGNFIEDDSFRAQHITTALGYMIVAVKNLEAIRKAVQSV